MWRSDIGYSQTKYAKLHCGPEELDRKEGFMAPFRLRVVPATLFGLLGLFALLGGAGVLVIVLTSSMAAMRGSRELAVRYAEQIPALAFVIAAGLMWLKSAVAWWRGSWRCAMLTAFVGVISLAISEWLVHR